MKNYFYNLPVELQEYIFDINNSRAIVSIRTTIKIKLNYIMNLISNLIYNNTSEGIYLYPNPQINFQGGNSLLFGMIYPICPYSSYIIHILNTININLTDNIFSNIFIPKSSIHKCRNFIIWIHFLNGLYNGLLYRNSAYEFNNILNNIIAYKNYNIISEFYNLFRFNTITTYIRIHNKTNLKVSEVSQLLNIPPHVSAFSVF